MWRYGAMLVLVSTAFLQRGFGCTCFTVSRPCEYLRSNVAFVGQVIETRPVNVQIHPGRWSPGFSMRFSVEESLRGNVGPEVVVETGQGGGDCGTPLRPGDRFLIFAFQGPDGELETGLCSGNKALNGNMQDFQFLENLRALVKTGKSSISGFVLREGIRSPEQQEPSPVPGMIIHAMSDGFSATTRTGNDGAYQFDELPKGNYTVSPEVPSGFDFDRSRDRLYRADLADGACTRLNFALKPATRIRGRVIVPSGTEGNLFAAAVPVPVKQGETSERRVKIDESGRFDLWPLSPGDYLVRVNFTSSATGAFFFVPVYYPGVQRKTAAAVVHVQEGEATDVELPLPAATPPRKVHLVAVDRNGHPMRAMKIELEDLRDPGELEGEVSIGLDSVGEGDLTISSGYSYNLYGSSLERGDQAWCSKPVQITANTAPVQARFVMDRKADDCHLEKN